MRQAEKFFCKGTQLCKILDSKLTKEKLSAQSWETFRSAGGLYVISCPHIPKPILDYLIQKLPFDFFEFINPHKNLYWNFCHLGEKHFPILDELAQGFLDLVDKQFD